MPKEVEYPQVTEIQVEIWLGDIVTKTFLQCMGWRLLDSRDVAGNGELVDSASADLTHALLHRELGKQDMCGELSEPEKVLEHYAMIDHPEPEPEPEEKEDG